MNKEITVKDADSVRLDRYLRRTFKGTSQGIIEKAARKKDILLNGAKCSASSKVKAGDKISYYGPLFENKQPQRELEGVSNFSSNVRSLAAKITGEYLLVDTAELIAIDKPHGIAVQGGSKIDLSINDAINYLNHENPDHPPFKLVHRLDKATSGALLIAKGYENAARLGEAFKEGKIEKTYLALVNGQPKKERGRVENYIGKVKSGGVIPGSTRNLRPEHGPQKKLVQILDQESGKLAITDYQVLRSTGRQSLIEYHPKTGRMHQIRVHSKALGCPIVGDVKYGGPRHGRMMLHAKSLIIPKNIFGRIIKIESKKDLNE